jgi:hypothetical protein
VRNWYAFARRPGQPLPLRVLAHEPEDLADVPRQLLGLRGAVEVTPLVALGRGEVHGQLGGAGSVVGGVAGAEVGAVGVAAVVVVAGVVAHRGALSPR